MIRLEGVSKTYRLKGIRKDVLREVDLHIARGTNLAILGPNGAGKSTLMRIIAGAEQPDRGRVTRSVRLSWPLGFSGGFNGSMTGIENVRFVARIYGADVGRVVAFVEEFSELGPSLGLPIRTYSNGMKARLAFGMSMAIEFDVYLIDEITAVGDEAFKRKSKQVFETRLKTANIVMISHSAAQIREYCNGAVILREGRVLPCEDVDTALRLCKTGA